MSSKFSRGSRTEPRSPKVCKTLKRRGFYPPWLACTARWSAPPDDPQSVWSGTTFLYPVTSDPRYYEGQGVDFNHESFTVRITLLTESSCQAEYELATSEGHSTHLPYTGNAGWGSTIVGQTIYGEFPYTDQVFGQAEIAAPRRPWYD